ncbi:carboxypeptidase regulatory-like domain-containing protein [Leptospira noumeaensis]|uniref:Carboxypeptidase regulatory-like domain-containing protein n=1 Tax=Leptospira noumeaensis TaxID=2484964 RepID=A0A4R9I8S2_9LEPT|nr:carboxypeptidase regulatory-like domain-containing protein [Leptospira noumeaensis]
MIRKLKYSLLIVLLLIQANCYYNPFVQKILAPDPKEDSSILLGLPLLGGLTPAPFALSIAGQIRNETGAVVSNAELKVIHRSNELEGLDSTVTTDSGGRFFIHLSTGSTTFEVTLLGSTYFTFTLFVSSPQDIRVSEIKGNSNPLEVSSFFAYEPGNQPSFFELTYSIPYNNQILEYTPESFNFYFSDFPQGLGQVQAATWLAENITVIPAISLNNVEIMSESIFISAANFTNGVTYSITLGPGIRSQSGIPLTPRTLLISCLSECGY